MHLPRNLFKNRFQWQAAHVTGRQANRLTMARQRRYLRYAKRYGQLHVWGDFLLRKGARRAKRVAK